MKYLAKSRKPRLHKKLRTGDFQELGFDIKFSIPESVADNAIEAWVDTLINDILTPQGLGFGGEGDKHWQGIVCTLQIGKCTEAHREMVANWLTAQQAQNVVIGPLVDLWWG